MSTTQTASKKTYILLMICLLYLTFSLACDPLAFRQISIAGHIMGGSAIIYAPLYILLDAITRLEGKRFAIWMVVIFHFFDLVFTYTLYGINLLPVPDSFQNLASFHTIINPLPSLFWSGILGSIIAGIAEILIFSFFQTRARSFWIVSFCSTTFILIAHNIPVYFFTFRQVFPQTYHQMFVINTSIEACIALLFALILNAIFKKVQPRQADFASV